MRSRSVTKTFSTICLLALCWISVSCETVGRGLGKVRNPAVSGDPCGHADWFEVGRVDGLSGATQEHSAYVGRCLSQGREFDQELYQAGWQKGLIEYCTPERGFDAGRSGVEYGGICPPHMEAQFLRRFKVGAQIAELERKNNAIETQIDARISQLSSITNSSAPTVTASRVPGSILSDALSRQAASEKQKQSQLQSQLQLRLQNEIQELRDSRARNDLTIRELEAL